MRGMRLGTVLGLALYAALSAAAAPAATIYSNLDAASASGWGLNGEAALLASEPVWLAASFTPAADYHFDAAEVVLAHLIGTNAYTFSLNASSGGGGLPGSVIEELGTVGTSENAPAMVDLPSAAHPLLTAGTTYWLVAKAFGDTMGGWMQSQGSAGFAQSEDNGGSWFPFPLADAEPAFAIEGTPVGATAVPLPSSAAMGVLGLAGVGLLAHRRQGAL